MPDDIRTLLVIDNLFARYTILVEPVEATTSIYCDECGHWVAQYDGDQLTTHTSDQLYEKIVNDHERDFPSRVEFSNDTVTFK